MIDKMGNFSKQLEKREERKEKDKLRKEKLAEFFFSLSNTVFGSNSLTISLNNYVHSYVDENKNINNFISFLLQPSKHPYKKLHTYPRIPHVSLQPPFYHL